MASPPPKRQRRSRLVLSNEDDGDDEEAVQLPLRASTRTNGGTPKTHIEDATALLKSPSKPKLSKTKRLAKNSPKASPKKPASAFSSTDTAEGTSLHTFFTRATEEQRWKRQSKSPEKSYDDDEVSDAIEDDELAGTDTDHSIPKPKSLLKLLPNTTVIKSEYPPASDRVSFSSSQRFTRSETSTNKSNLVTGNANQSTIQDGRPWAERYQPANIDELVVHKKKVADVHRWLTNALNGKEPQRLLVLKGPAGSGKSTTLSLLARAIGSDLVWWSNPTAAESSSKSSVGIQFGDFLSRSGAYSHLQFTEEQPTSSSIVSDVSRILAIEEFPTSLARSTHALDAFRSTIMQYISGSTGTLVPIFGQRQPRPSLKPPLVLIITETLLSSSTAATDSFTAHRLLGSEICNHPLVTMMEFNPVAQTLMTKALEVVVKKEARDTGRRRTPGPAVLGRLAEIGDLRSAVNSLEFLCIRGDEQTGWSGTVAHKAKRVGKEGVPLTDMERESLELLSQRESTLDMFHATGKVVYNKREDPRISRPEAQSSVKPPDHLAHLHRAKVSEVDIDALLNETGTDIQTFISTVHENYILSCNGNAFVDSFDGCSAFLSDSDILNPDNRGISRSNRGGNKLLHSAGTVGATETLRQDEISFQVVTRGLLFNLPYPVHRAPHPAGRKGDSFKMFYPAALRLWKPMEEIEALVSMFMDSDTENRSSKPTTSFSGGVASWRTRADQYERPSMNEITEGQMQDRPVVSRDALVLETLPFLAQIELNKSPQKTTTKHLVKITQFHGLRVNEFAEEEPFDEDSQVTDLRQVSSNRVADAINSFTRSQTGARHGEVTEATKKTELKDEKLYISDDDIIDD